MTASGRLAPLFDHTLLRADANRAEIERLCAEAVEHGFATVCVNPCWVPLCVSRLRGGDVGVCTVAGFPLGATTTDVKAFETRQALAAGAREIDVVINLGALASGEDVAVEADLAAVARVCRAEAAVCKAILEMVLLSDERKRVACRIAQAAGAHFVKTSTGFGPAGATVEDVALMRHLVGPAMGIKAAGGIRTRAMVEALVAAGATRIGSSASVAIVGGEGTPGPEPRPPR